MTINESVKLTAKEEEIMSLYWKHGAMFVKDVIELLPADSNCHYNTIATFVKGLENKGLLGRKQYGNTHQYYPIVSETAYRDGSVKVVLDRYFNNSSTLLISNLIEQEMVSVDEIKELLQRIEQGK